MSTLFARPYLGANLTGHASGTITFSASGVSSACMTLPPSVRDIMIREALVYSCPSKMIIRDALYYSVVVHKKNECI
jgi:hypothetical protein